MADKELVEKCLEGVKKRRFKPDWEGFSSCVQCERDTVARAIPTIKKAVAEEIKKELEELFVVGNQIDITDKRKKPFYKMNISVDQWQAFFKERGVE